MANLTEFRVGERKRAKELRSRLIPIGCAVFVLMAIGPLVAQQSASYKLEESVLNSGGDPLDGISPGSISFLMTQDALGDGILPIALSSPSFTIDGGLPAAFLPPGEVEGVMFTGTETLIWEPEPAAGVYNLYKGNLGSDGSSDCEQPGLPLSTSTETAAPAAGAGWFYLITVENRLDVEGTRGTLSTGAQRTGGTCP